MFKSNTIKTIYNLLFKILPANYQINTFINKSEMVSNFNFQQDDYEIYSTFIFNFAAAFESGLMSTSGNIY